MKVKSKAKLLSNIGQQGQNIGRRQIRVTTFGWHGHRRAWPMESVGDVLYQHLVALGEGPLGKGEVRCAGQSAFTVATGSGDTGLIVDRLTI